MALTLRVIARPDTALGFELAGLDVARADDAAAAAAALRRLVDEGQAGIVLVDEGLYRGLPKDLATRLDRQALPVVAPFPSPAWDARGTAEAYVLDILRQAIGYRVRPR